MSNAGSDLLIMLFFRKDGSLNILGKIALILGILLAGVVASMLSGCVNIAYTRNPLSSARICSVYKSTNIAWTLSYVVAFPQTVGLMKGDGLMVENLISVPCGCVVLVDAACEAVIDTVCLPVDWPLSRYRSKKWHEWQNDNAQKE